MVMRTLTLTLGTGKLMTFGEGDFLLSWDDERTKAQHALCLIDVQKGANYTHICDTIRLLVSSV
jgi:hypothetical protein